MKTKNEAGIQNEYFSSPANKLRTIVYGCQNPPICYNYSIKSKKESKIMTTENMYTLVFTESQLDVIYDAINELNVMTDDRDTLKTISEISDIMYNANHKIV